MLDRALKKVILIDGEMAGSIVDAPPGGMYVHVPRPLKLPIAMFDAEPSLAHLSAPRDISYLIYRTHYFLRGEIPIPFLAGHSGPGEPPREALAEHVPAALALLDVIPWTCVPDTPLDESEPIAVTDPGDPLTPCAPYLDDYFGREIAGRCCCGWQTMPVTPDRRSQIARAHFRHGTDIERRRRTEDLAIRILDVGHPAFACSPMIRQDDRNWADGVCNCGWRTQQVPPFLAPRIMDLCGQHLDAADAVWSEASARGARAQRPEFDGIVESLTGAYLRDAYDRGAARRELGLSPDAIPGLDWGDPLVAADANWPDDASQVCAHICGGDHDCDVRATTTLTYGLPSGGKRTMPICATCKTAEAAVNA